MGKFRTLERTQLFKDWGADERVALAFFLEERKIPEGDPVFLKNSREQALYIVESGSVRLSFESIHLDLHEGETFGELSLIQGSQKLVSAVTTSATILWALTHERWLELKRNTPSVAVKLMESILRKTSSQISKLQMPPRFSSSKVSAS